MFESSGVDPSVCHKLQRYTEQNEKLKNVRCEKRASYSTITKTGQKVIPSFAFYHLVLYSSYRFVNRHAL